MFKEQLVTNTENRDSEAEKQLQLTRSLLPLVKKVSFFSTDTTDEFRVTRENGSTEGIFKTWAVPVIPFLEADQERNLAWCMHNRTGNFLEVLTPELHGTLQVWHDKLRENPARLWQTLERWRSFCEIYDRRLTRIFQESKLPDSKEERLAELYWRLKIAFAYASPFYHLEAMVADKNQTPANPVEVNVDIDGGGALDMVGMLLPAALSAAVTTKPLNWSGINWHKIKDLTSSLKPGTPEFNITFRISRSLGVSLEHVIFAANVLEWIPVSVGGKRADISPAEAQMLVDATLRKTSSALSSTVIGRDFNAQIRFLNWFPSIENQLNFDNGEGWRYSAACDTSNQLLKEVDATDPFNPDFAVSFRETISLQISHVDATSAKGRLAMKLIEEGKLKPEFYAAIKKIETE